MTDDPLDGTWVPICFDCNQRRSAKDNRRTIGIPPKLRYAKIWPRCQKHPKRRADMYLQIAKPTKEPTP